jgi:CBS domain-containing protein/gamma-glutamyl:cysteine ligase YbdK (ATP-grasp superfamily)
MGQHHVELELDGLSRQLYMQALLDDLRALDYMLDNGLIETGVRRIGAEQELFLVDRDFRPAPIAMEVLQDAKDPRLTTEIARFNLEANLSPLKLTRRCFSEMENELKEVLQTARASANKFEADILLAGILPTLRQSDLSLENITPAPRYHQLNQSVAKLRGGPFSIHIKGLDEIQLAHDNIMMESCNTSFQIHLQVDPSKFVELYNMAQAITAPVVAAAVNSPLLFGKRLWQETRLALFQQSTDSRSATQQARSQPTRVGFGERWLERSVLELFRDQVARFRVIMTTQPEESSLSVLAHGGIPPLSALRLHNGTIWPWNRACYGVANGIAHLRIENRALPSGPTTLDEIANAAFFVGLMTALPDEYGDITKIMTFDQAKENFFVAARYGLDAQFAWIEGKTFGAHTLILNHLLPLARSGLKQSEVASEDIDLYLGTIEERVRSRQTGAQWVLSSFAALGDKPRDFRCRLLAEEIRSRQQSNEPVHRWSIPEEKDLPAWSDGYQTVGQFMSTDLFTMRPDDLVDLAANLMDWRHIRHVPVENDEGQLVGLISHRSLLRLLTRGRAVSDSEPVTVRDIMRTDPVTVSSTTPTLEAIEIMRSHKFGCLPVVDNGRLVGIVTSYDFLDASARLFVRELKSKETPQADVNEEPGESKTRAAEV